jgi:hypothetical protein
MYRITRCGTFRTMTVYASDLLETDSEIKKHSYIGSVSRLFDALPSNHRPQPGPFLNLNRHVVGGASGPAYSWLS